MLTLEERRLICQYCWDHPAQRRTTRRTTAKRKAATTKAKRKRPRTAPRGRQGEVDLPLRAPASAMPWDTLRAPA
jgi:hypothetical protein